MKYYFQLQYKMLNRHLIDFGISPIIAYLLLFVGFVLGSNILFTKPELATYVYFFINLSLLFKLNEKCRNDFLKISFPVKKYKKIRIVENLLITSPFVIYLIYKQQLLNALLLLVLAVLFSFFKQSKVVNFTIPTPFKKHPFEFVEGFRKTILVFPFIYTLTIIGIKVNNFNLGVFSLIAIFLVSISYFSKTEKPYYVWLFNKTPKDFLYFKIKRAFIYTLYISLPIVVVLSVFFTSKIIIIIGFQLIGYVYLAQSILAKYSIFPKQVSLPTGLIYFLSLSLPPFVLVTSWHFYKEAIKKLNTVLND